MKRMDHADWKWAVALADKAHSPVRNYVVPGVTSSLIERAPDGTLYRLFESSRSQQDGVTPHSHRFGFTAWVLSGRVTNRLWHLTDRIDGDEFAIRHVHSTGVPGATYTTQHAGSGFFRYADDTYGPGDVYSMTAPEIHSIFFSRGAVVLFAERPAECDWSVALEPIVDNEVIPTLKVEPWMFRK